MKISLRSLVPRLPASFASLLRRQLQPLAESRRIDEVRITVERPEQASPPWRLAIQLVTPGPDFVSRVHDHTLAAALGRAVGALREQITRRHDKLARRLRRAGAPRGPVARA